MCLRDDDYDCGDQFVSTAKRGQEVYVLITDERHLQAAFAYLFRVFMTPEHWMPPMVAAGFSAELKAKSG